MIRHEAGLASQARRPKVSTPSCSGTFFFRTHGTEERLSIITILIIIILVLLVIYVARRAL